MEKSNTNVVETAAKITYQFTAVPTNLFILLDNNCRSMLFTLIQLSSFYSNEDGYFFRTNSDLSEESNLSQKLVIATIDTLYSKGLIAVNTVGKAKGKQANYYKVNFEIFTEYEKYSKEELKNPVLKIETIDYKAKGYSPSYLSKVSQSTEQSYHQDFPKVSPTFPKVPTNIDNIYNKENINYIDNIYKEDITNIYNTENKNKLEVMDSAEVDLNTESDSNLNNNTIEIKTNNDMDKQINENKAILIPTVIGTITNTSENNFKAAGETLYDNPKEDVNEAGNVGNNALKCVIPTDEETNTIEKDKNSIKTKIDKIMDLAGHLESGSLPTDDINKTIAFFKELENKAYTELTVYMFNDQLIQYGKEIINEAMSINEEFLNKFYSLVEAEENNSNVGMSDFKATGNTLSSKLTEDTNESGNVENNASECAISTNMDIEVNSDTIVEPVNNITIDNNNTVVESNNSNKINVETPIGFIQSLNQKYERNKIDKDEYIREIDYLKRNYFNQYNKIKELILPMAV